MGNALNFDTWWGEPTYKRCWSFPLRGAFILDKLRAHDTAKLQDVLADLYREAVPEPEDITRFQWEIILRYMGASPEEIAEVQTQMGRVWT